MARNVKADLQAEKVVILSGGYGTRLKPFTLSLPKPMIPFVNRPILEHIIRRLAKQNYRQATLLLLYRPEKISGYFKEGRNFGLNLEYSVANQDFGTAGAVRSISKTLDSTFLVVSGDLVTDVDLRRAVEFHRKKGGIATMILARVQNPLPFGIVLLDEDQRVQQFVEKPSTVELVSDTVNAGMYVLEPEIFYYIPADRPFYFAQDLFPLLLQEGVPIYGYVHEGYWQDIGDLRQYLLSHHDFLAGKFELPDIRVQRGKVNAGKGVQLGQGASFEGTVIIGENSIIGDGAKIVNSILGENTTVGPGAEIVDSVIWSDVQIGASSHLVSDVVASGTRVGRGVSMDDNVFIAQGCEIGDLAVIKSNVKIWPERKVGRGAIVTSSLIWGERWLRELFVNNAVAGVINQEVTPEFGARLGAAFGTYLGPGGYVLVSRDASAAARMIHRSLICGLMSAGVNIGDLRVTPLPLLRYALQRGPEKGGVHVRQSASEENTVEILFLEADGEDLASPRAKSVERLFMQEDFNRARFEDIGHLDFPVRVMESYQEEFLKNLDVSAIERARFKIVVDYSFGPAGLILPSILGSLDCEVVALNAYLDPKRAIRQWSDFRYAMLQLSNIVVSLKSDLGILIDAGTERIFAVDEDGHLVRNEHLHVLLTKMFLDAYRPKAIGVPVASSDRIRKFAEDTGTRVVETRQEHRSMVEAIRKHNLAFVGDGQGGYIFPEFHYAIDGMFAMAKTLELLAKTETRFGELRQQIPQPIMDERKVECAWERIGTILRHLVETESRQVESTLDGVKLRFPEGWLLATPDRSGSAIRLVAEGKSRRWVDSVLGDYVQKIQGMIESLHKFGGA